VAIPEKREGIGIVIFNLNRMMDDLIAIRSICSSYSGHICMH